MVGIVWQAWRLRRNRGGLLWLEYGWQLCGSRLRCRLLGRLLLRCSWLWLRLDLSLQRRLGPPLPWCRGCVWLLRLGRLARLPGSFFLLDQIGIFGFWFGAWLLTRLSRCSQSWRRGGRRGCGWRVCNNTNMRRQWRRNADRGIVWRPLFGRMGRGTQTAGRRASLHGVHAARDRNNNSGNAQIIQDGRTPLKSACNRRRIPCRFANK